MGDGTVISLTKEVEESDALKLEFKKARLRTPRTRDQFETQLIVRHENGWAAVAGDPSRPGGKRPSEQRDLMADNSFGLTTV